MQASTTMTTNQRQAERIAHRANIRVMTVPKTETVLEMRDFSETGMYLFCDEDFVNVGDKVEVQTLEIEDAPVILSQVVRVEDTGFAVQFIL